MQKNTQKSIFAAVKESVTMQQAAELCGLDVRQGVCPCPFHNEKTPSMKLYPDHYYCFGCHAHGDVIDLTAKMRNLSEMDAARLLADAFHVPVPVEVPKRKAREPCKPHQVNAGVLLERMADIIRRSEIQRREAWLNHALDVLIHYARLLIDWQEQYAPKPEDIAWHPLFVAAVRNEKRIWHMMSLLEDSVERPYFFDQYHQDVEKIEQRMQKGVDSAAV